MIYSKYGFSLLALLLFILILPSAHHRTFAVSESPETKPLPRLGEWISPRDSFPLLSSTGEEAKQFRLIVRTIEEHRGESPDQEEVADAFSTLFQSLQEHFAPEGELSQHHPGMAGQINALAGLTVAKETDRMVLTCRGKTKEISLHKKLDRIAEETIKNAQKLIGEKETCITTKSTR